MVTLKGVGDDRKIDKKKGCGSERAVARHHRPEIGSRLPAGTPGRLGLEMTSTFRVCATLKSPEGYTHSTCVQCTADIY